MVVKVVLTLCLAWSGFAAAASITAANLEKACRAQKKSRALCACVVKNIEARLKNKDFSEEQAGDIERVLANVSVRDEEKSGSYDAMADFVAGLEFHCRENPKYSGE
jgi:hypothetical protein